MDRFKLTKSQYTKMLNQHVGTGAICYKSSSDTICTIEFCLGKDNKLHTMTGYTLDLKSVTEDISEE